MKNFIEVYDDALSKDHCIGIIDEFENTRICDNDDDNKVDDICKHIVKRNLRGNRLKYSLDLTVSFMKQNYHINRILMSCLLKYSKLYLNENPELKIFDGWGLNDIYNIQKYEPNQAYFGDHFENNHMQGFSRRIMAWMIYLNTVTDDGGTYFTNYDKTLKAVEGRLVIWPAYWTHTHRGIPSSSQIKYIATGWFDSEASFNFYPQFIN